MMGMYDSWFDEIKTRLSGITDSRERIEFLFNEKLKFVSLNSGFDAKRIAKMFKVLIDKEKINLTGTLPNARKTNTPKYTMRHIALKYFYEGKIITRENGGQIARDNGHKSGEKLYQYFTIYSNNTDRKAIPTNCTKTTLRNKIELFEGVIKTLENPYKSRAEDELRILKNCYNSDCE